MAEEIVFYAGGEAACYCQQVEELAFLDGGRGCLPLSAGGRACFLMATAKELGKGRV